MLARTVDGSLTRPRSDRNRQLTPCLSSRKRSPSRMKISRSVIAVTERSAHYVAASMMYMAEASGVGSCLMDSIYLTFRTDRRLTRSFGITKDVLAAIVFGYSDEKVINIPGGYEMETRFI